MCVSIDNQPYNILRHLAELHPHDPRSSLPSHTTILTELNALPPPQRRKREKERKKGGKEKKRGRRKEFSGGSRLQRYRSPYGAVFVRPISTISASTGPMGPRWVRCTASAKLTLAMGMALTVDFYGLIYKKWKYTIEYTASCFEIQAD